MFGYNIVAALAIGCLVQVHAIQITAPDKNTVWDSSTSSQTITWSPVNTDADSFAIQLVNQQGYLSDSPVTLVANQSIGTAATSNTVTVTYPDGSWPTGVAFQINFVSSSTDSDAAIYAQSGQFNITSDGSSSSSSSAASSSSSSAASSSSSSSSSATSTATSATTTSAASSPTTLTTTSAGTSSTTAGDASGGIPNASTSTSSSASLSSLADPTGLVGLLLGLAGLMGVFA